MQKKVGLLGFLCLVITMLLSGCGIAQEQYNAALGERDTAKNEVQSTKGELEVSRNQVSELTANLTKTQENLFAAIRERDEKQAKNLQFESSLNLVQDTLSSARKNISSLESDITALKARIPVLEYATYTSNETGFSINYPKKWNMLLNLFKNGEGIISFIDVDTGANIAVAIEKLPVTMTSVEYFNEAIDKLPDSYEFWGSKEVTLNKIKAEKGTLTSLKVGGAIVMVSLVNGNTAYTIVLTHNVNDFFDYSHTFNEMINSFKILGKGGI